MPEKKTRYFTAIAIAALLLSLHVAGPAIAQERLSAEEEMKRQAFADNNFDAIMMPQNEEYYANNPPASPVQAALEALAEMPAGDAAVSPYASPAPRRTQRTPAVAPGASTEGAGSSVEVPLDVFEDLRDRMNAINEQTARRQGPTVALGSSEYSGRAIKGALLLDLRLQVTLGQPGVWKTVPLIGDDVVLVSGTVDGERIPVTRWNGYQVWVTDRDGEATVEMKILVPSRGPRGSLEYDFLVPRTPVTRFTCEFPAADLEPRLDTAVQSEIEPGPASTTLKATLKPTTRIHLVGFKDMGESEEQPARIFAESLNLLSVDEKAIDLFTVIRYTILYSGAKHFDVEIPAGMSVVSADGEGAFRFTIEQDEGGEKILRGETAFPIRNGYEISLRLKRQLDREQDENTARFEAPIPRCIGVEREHGWIAVEVPGKLKLGEEDRKEALAVDVRQLPPEMVASAVSPIIRSYRYHSPERTITLEATLLPDMEPSSGSVDRIRAFSVISPEGKIITDMRITMRNRLKPTLALELPEDATVRSVHLDGEAIRPSRDDDGHLVLPLKRSEGGDRLTPFTLQVVLETTSSPLGLFGISRLSLPALELPASSSEWSVFLPSKNIYSSLHGDVEPQTFAAEARWHEPSGSSLALSTGDLASLEGAPGSGEATGGDSGLMAVRIELPRTGTRLDYTRYWLDGGVPLEISFRHIRSWLTIPAGIALAILLALACVLAATRLDPHRPRLLPWIGLGLAAAVLWPLGEIGGGWGVFAGFAIGFAAIALRRRWFTRAPAAVLEWLRSLGPRFGDRAGAARGTATARVVKLSIVGAVMVTACFALLGLGIQLIELLGNPL